LAKEQKPKRTQTDKQRQQNHCSNVWKRSQTTGRARHDSADHQHSKNQNNPKQAKQNERAEMVCYQQGDVTKRLYRSATPPVHHRHHEVSYNADKNGH
jgi:hypothetical protein